VLIGQPPQAVSATACASAARRRSDTCPVTRGRCRSIPARNPAVDGGGLAAGLYFQVAELVYNPPRAWTVRLSASNAVIATCMPPTSV